MANKKHELTEAEWSIVQAVWDKEPCTAPDIQETLERERSWTYSTVKTLMDRMVKKGLLKTEKIRNLILYSSAVTPRQAKYSEITKVVKRAFNGAMTPMMQFLLDNSKLTEDDLQQLEEAIKDKRKSNLGGKNNKKAQ